MCQLSGLYIDFKEVRAFFGYLGVLVFMYHPHPELLMNVHVFISVLCNARSILQVPHCFTLGSFRSGKRKVLGPLQTFPCFRSRSRVVAHDTKKRNKEREAAEKAKAEQMVPRKKRRRMKKRALEPEAEEEEEDPE